VTIRIVGIGASAGGLEAVTELLGALSAGNGMAYIVVQHLDRAHGSVLPEILAKRTSLPVKAATDGELVESDHVYVIPPNATLTVEGDRLRLTERSAGVERHLPVDALFRSLAVACDENAIGVVLSGGDADGSLGIQAIKEQGGVVFAQTPATAQVDSMPRHAIETGCVDMALPPREIAHELQRLGAEFDSAQQGREPAADGGGDPAARRDEESLRHILWRLRTVHGVDFKHYKHKMLKRRLARRMMLRGVKTLAEYRTLIDGDPAELAALHQDFLIRVTEFFRDPDSFEALRQHVFPALRERDPAKQAIRIWVPGCATGEEVYSLAIALVEFLGDEVSHQGVQIFGTDVNEAALEKARAGIYPVNALRHVSPERTRRFFVANEHQCRIAKEIRDLCIFARQDVTRDPPFSRLDLISCRNLLIYLDEVAQRRVLQVFHFALRPDGMVLFGPAESIGQSSELFEQADHHVRLYRRRSVPGTRTAISRSTTPEDHEKGTAPAPVETDSVTREADRFLLARFAPASLLIDDALHIQQFRGRTGPFLEPVSGSPSFDLRRVVRPELLVQLLPLIQQARQTHQPARRSDLRLDDALSVDIEVMPVGVATAASSYLILLEDVSNRGGDRRAAAPTVTLTESEKDARVSQLQREVDAMREYLRGAIEEHGAVTEELKSAHEELLSANEEFQSTNEELETSKEELQSTNEELTTTIEELRSRNRDLAVLNAELDKVRVVSDRAAAYADVIIETVREPLAVLDGALRIQRVNQSFLAFVGIPREKIEGQLLVDLQDGLWRIPELEQRLRAVVGQGRPVENWELTQDLGNGGRRVLMLSASKIPGDAERSDLLLIAIDDVTERANITADLLANNRRKDEFLATLAHELRHPLTPIVHAIHLLRLGETDAATAALYETIDTQAQRLRRFVTELLDVARVSRALINIKREPLDFVVTVRQALETVRPLVDARRHHLAVTLPGTQLRVSGDPDRLTQVVVNLLENAVKYTPPGGEISVALARRGDEAVLTVRDSGIGIATEHLKRIFDLFAKADSGREQDDTGLGLGLSIVRGVLELHGGHIEARSAGLGKGSEFIATIPALDAPVADSGRGAGPGKTHKAMRARPKRVLIVDDHQEIVDSLGRLTRRWGHTIEVARDGPSALEVAARFQPEAAILDIGLPGMNGYELARHLRESFPPDRLRLIAMTGYGDVDIRDSCREAGFDVCLVKPGDIDELEEILARELPRAERLADAPRPDAHHH